MINKTKMSVFFLDYSSVSKSADTLLSADFSSQVKFNVLKW